MTHTLTEEDGTSSGENAVSAENRRPGPQSTSTPTQNYQQHVEKPPPLNPRAAQPHYHGRGHRDPSAAVRPDSSLARGTQLQLSMPERSHNAPPNVVHVRSQSHSNPPPHKTPTDHHMQNGHDADTHSPTPPAISPIKAPKDKKKGSFFKGLGTMFSIKESPANVSDYGEIHWWVIRQTSILMKNQQNLQNGIPPPPMRTQSRQAAGNHVENPKRVDMNGDYLANCTPAGNYEDMSRPGCRSGFVDPSRYSHYENYSEIQQHLSGRIIVEKEPTPAPTAAEYVPMTSDSPSMTDALRKSYRGSTKKKVKPQPPRPKSSQFYVELSAWESLVESSPTSTMSPLDNACKYEFNRTRSCNGTVLSGGAGGPKRFPSPVVVDCANNNPREIRRYGLTFSCLHAFLLFSSSLLSLAATSSIDDVEVVVIEANVLVKAVRQARKTRQSVYNYV
ncbi:unnamed protein product [Notodromas monacha]|uniref:Uncharacterized protein n=1 Tax=Notodromas monacha TaxID=399045 RepID=A0A7R9BKT6_9CRUS|nr:unnamed protein product [Notodromas monacha]CAG0916001.1 unnamed protein product [Notodromas monacha]